MKTFANTLPWAALLLAHVNAQDDGSSSTYDDSGDNIVTSYYTLCPSSTTTSSATYSVTNAPNQVTMTGDDGRETIYRTETTILPHMCPDNDGVCGATYTLSSECPCMAGPQTVTTEGTCPEGFTTTVVECTACANSGGPSTVTVTVPMSNGPYASVTPQYGSPVANPTDICTDDTPQATATPSTDNGSNSTSSRSGSDSGSGKYGSSSNMTKPYNPTTSYKPYAGAAGRLDIGLDGCLAIIGAGIVGALAIFL